MAKLNLDKFKENADKIIQEKSTQGLFSELSSKLITLELDLLHSHPLRAKLDNSHLEELGESIEKWGQIEPIVVRKTETGYEVLDGHSRVSATKSIGGESLLCLQVNVTKEEADFYPLLCNRETLDDFELSYYLERLQRTGYTKKKIAKKLALDTDKFTTYGFEYNLFQVLQNSQLIQYKDIKEIANISNEGLRDETLDHVVQKLLTRDEIKNYLKRVKEEELGLKFVLKEAGVKIKKNTYKVSIDLDERELSEEEVCKLYNFLQMFQER